MTWTIHFQGHDSLESGEKVAFEKHLEEKAIELANHIKRFPGVHFSSGSVQTNTTGTLDLSPVVVPVEPIEAPVEPIEAPIPADTPDVPVN